MNQLLINDYISVFSGNNLAYGQHTYGEIVEGQKEIGGKSWTVKDRPVSPINYTDHLSGKDGLGIIPITRENQVKFSVIDIDIYNKGQEQTAITAIQNSDCPLAVFRSKSGGYHIYLFFNEMIPAATARKYIDKFIRLFSIDVLCSKGNQGVEIFPKQITVTKGQLGNWINLPYWGGLKSKQCMVSNGKELSLDEAMVIIRDQKVSSISSLDAFFASRLFSDAPPCLQSIFYLGDLDSNRNNFLFSAGVYFQKKNEDSFERDLFELNGIIPRPLPDKELESTVIQSIRKKGYGYKCKDAPCITYCNKTECKNRAFGIGDGGCVSELDFGALKQICTDPPYYEWEINGKGIRFKDEDEIIQQTEFRRKCMRLLHYAPFKLKDPDWMKIINTALSQVIVVAVNHYDDISAGAMFRTLFAEFILDRPFAMDKDHVQMGRVFNDEINKRYCFRIKDLVDFIIVQKVFKGFTPQEIHGQLNDMGCRPERIRTNSTSIRVHIIPHDYFIQREEVRPTEVIEFDFTPEDAPTESSAF